MTSFDNNNAGGGRGGEGGAGLRGEDDIDIYERLQPILEAYAGLEQRAKEYGLQDEPGLALISEKAEKLRMYGKEMAEKLEKTKKEVMEVEQTLCLLREKRTREEAEKIEVIKRAIEKKAQEDISRLKESHEQEMQTMKLALEKMRNVKDKEDKSFRLKIKCKGLEENVINFRKRKVVKQLNKLFY